MDSARGAAAAGQRGNNRRCLSYNSTRYYSPFLVQLASVKHPPHGVPQLGVRGVIGRNCEMISIFVLFVRLGVGSNCV